MDNNLIRKAILGNNLLWRCTFTDEVVVTPEYDLTYTFGVDVHFMSSCQRINIPIENLDSEISSIEKFYTKRNKPASFYLDPSSNPSELKETLQKKGYKELKSEEEVWWGYDLTQPIKELPSTTGLEIIECKNREQFEDHLQAAMLGYKDFKFWASLLSKSFRKPLDGIDVTHYVAYINNRPVACATLGLYLDIAYLINVTVIPEFRRMGIHTSMMQRRLIDAKQSGASVAFYQTDYDNEASIATGKKVGFFEAFRRIMYTNDK